MQNYVKEKHVEKAGPGYMNTNSFIVYINREDKTFP